jgi:hypothetical protein
MTTAEALLELAGRGVSLTVWELRGLINREEISRPRMNSSLAWDWTESDIKSVEDAVSNPEEVTS